MKVHHFTLVFLLPFLACSRNSGDTMNPSTGLKAQMSGKWTINNVTSLFYDSTNVLLGKNLYVCPPGYSYQFNSNNIWTELLLPDTLSVNGMSGTYEITGDSSFNLVNPAATGPTVCRMDTLTASIFVFQHDRGTHYNGVTPGYIRYLFHMTRGN